MSDTTETPETAPNFDFSAYPPDTLFYDRRSGLDRRDAPGSTPTPHPERRAKKDRRRRVDPTTFEKQYSDDEMEFMNAMQQFKVRSCKTFPSAGEVLLVALELGYRKAVWD
jgi:hypothetical protein